MSQWQAYPSCIKDFLNFILQFFHSQQAFLFWQCAAILKDTNDDIALTDIYVIRL